MLSAIRKLAILGLIGLSTFTVIQAASPAQDQHALQRPSTRSSFVETLRLESSRFSQPADDAMVDPQHIVPIHEDDIFQFENDAFRVYLQEQTHLIKVYDKSTGYVWASALEDPQAGTFTGLLSSLVGFEFINIPQNHNVRENVGLNEAETDVQVRVEGHTISFDITVGGFCATSQCRRLFEDYVTGNRTIEQMIAVGFQQLDFNFRLEVSLTDTGLVAHIPFSSIEEGNTERVQLSSLIIFPALGATRLDDIPGYMIIPDGVGALIRYEDNQGRFRVPFEERFFGPNAGVISGRQSVTSQPLSMPIFGAVHGRNQHGFLGIVEQGAQSARLLAFPNGASNIHYNLIFTKFDLRQVFRQSFSSDGTGGALRITRASTSDMTIRYEFLQGEEANYVGLARRYQDWLVTQGILSRLTQTAQVSPVHIQYVMADSRPRFIGKEIVTMSTFEDVERMHQHFVTSGLTNQRISLLGWNRGGYSGQLPSRVNHERALGSQAEFSRLISLLQEDHQVMLVNNYIRSTNGASRVSFRNDVAQGVNRFKLVRDCFMCVYDRHTILFPEATHRFAMQDLDDYRALEVDVLFESLGSMLFSSFDRELTLRGDAMAVYQDILASYGSSAQMNFAHAWAWANMEQMFAVPLYNSQLSYFDDLVPLLPIVLSGHVTMFSDFLNFNSLGQEQLLRLIDFGVHPSFMVSNERASTLRGTDIEHLFATHFSAWETTIIQQHRFVDDALRHVQGAQLIARDVLALGVVEVTYDNGVSFIINYTHAPFIFEGTQVPALDVLVLGVRP